MVHVKINPNKTRGAHFRASVSINLLHIDISRGVIYRGEVIKMENLRKKMEPEILYLFRDINQMYQRQKITPKYESASFELFTGQGIIAISTV